MRSALVEWWQCQMPTSTRSLNAVDKSMSVLFQLARRLYEEEVSRG